MKDRTQLMQFAAVALIVVLLSVPIGGEAGRESRGSDPALIAIEFSKAIVGTMSCEDKLNADSTILGCNKGGGFVLGEAITEAAGADPDCFAAGYTDGTIQLFLNNDGSAEAWFRFGGRDLSDANDVLYVLEAYAPLWNGPFPPEYGVDPTTMYSSDWVLRAANKRQEKDACLVRNGNAEITVSVRRLTE